MGRALVSAAAMVLVAACVHGDTPYDNADTTWRLQQMDGADFGANAMLTFPQPGSLSGEGPCNLYSAEMTGTYPAFAPGPLLSTQRACAFLAEEKRFFDALALMTRAHVNEDTLILSGPGGREMVFKTGDQAPR